jgi:hypothetical protein
MTSMAWRASNESLVTPFEGQRLGCFSEGHQDERRSEREQTKKIITAVSTY